jgi:hypothetical protein
MRAEEDRRAAPGTAGEAAEQIACIRVDPGTGVVLLDLEAEAAQLRGDAVGDRAFVPGRAGKFAECEKKP